jgi:hypothetical protein
MTNLMPWLRLGVASYNVNFTYAKKCMGGAVFQLVDHKHSAM